MYALLRQAVPLDAVAAVRSQAFSNFEELLFHNWSKLQIKDPSAEQLALERRALSRMLRELTLDVHISGTRPG